MVIFQPPRSLRGLDSVCRTDSVSNQASIGFQFERQSSPRRRQLVASRSENPLSWSVLFVGMHPVLTQYFPSVFRRWQKSPTIRLLLPEIGPRFRECCPHSYYLLSSKHKHGVIVYIVHVVHEHITIRPIIAGDVREIGSLAVRL
jgi:hypothetical protein